MDSKAVIARFEAAVTGGVAPAGGDPAVEAAAKALRDALGPAARQLALELTEQAADEVDAQVPYGRVEMVLRGGEPALVVRAGEEAERRPAGEEYEARIALRLPPSLKAAVEEAARSAGESVNSFLVRDLSGSLGVDVASGDLRVGDVGGDAVVRSASGDVEIGEVAGDAAVNTAPGDIKVRGARGRATLNTASGEVGLGDAFGPLSVSTQSGNLGVGRYEGEDLGCNTTSGDVRIGLRPGRGLEVDLDTVSGDIRSDFSAGDGRGATARLRVKTVSGGILLVRATDQ